MDLYGVWYRALVVHSDAYDERRVKKLERTLEHDKLEVERIASEQEKIEYACAPDAQAAVLRLPKGRFHELVGQVEEKPIYVTGRPKADGTRKIQRTTYRLKISLQPREEAIARARKEAGCFVLITNEPEESSGGLSSKELLRAYQDQHSVEQNFGFLKDPVIVNALFLKSPRRIEALGLILVLALMIWRLMERTMRVSLKESNTKVVGWNNRQTSRPTSFMMTTKFVSVIVIRTAEQRFLAEPLDPVAGEVSPDPRAVGGCFHKPLFQRHVQPLEAGWNRKEAPDETNHPHQPQPTHPLSGPLRTPPDTFVPEVYKNGVKRIILRSTKARVQG